MVNKDRHLGAVTSSESEARENGSVEVHTDGIPELRRWLKTPHDIKEVSLDYFRLPAFVVPQCGVTGKVEMTPGPTISISSRITPISPENDLPTSRTFFQGLKNTLDQFTFAPVSGNRIAFRRGQGTTFLQIFPHIFLINTKFGKNYEPVLAERFAAHADVLAGVIESLITQSGSSDQFPPQTFPLTPLLGNDSRPRPPRAA